MGPSAPLDLTLVRQVASANNHLAVICVARADGTIHGSLVNAGVLTDPLDGREKVGAVVQGSARKLAHLRARPRATLVFAAGYRWVSVEGPVRLEGPDDPAETDFPMAQTIRAIYRSAGGEHEDWMEFDRVMAEERRCAVFVYPERVITN